MLRILTARYGSSFQPGPWSHPGEGGPCRVESITGEEGMQRGDPWERGSSVGDDRAPWRGGVIEF